MFPLDVSDPTASYVAPIVTALVGLAVAIITAATPIVVHALVTWLKRKTQIEISEKAEKDIARALERAVLVTEQTTRAKLKLGENAPDGAEKLEQTVKLAEKYLKDLGVYDQVKDRIVDEIEAQLGKINGPLTMQEKDEIRNSLPPPAGERPGIQPLPKKPKKIGE